MRSYVIMTLISQLRTLAMMLLRFIKMTTTLAKTVTMQMKTAVTKIPKPWQI